MNNEPVHFDDSNRLTDVESSAFNNNEIEIAETIGSQRPKRSRRPPERYVPGNHTQSAVRSPLNRVKIMKEYLRKAFSWLGGTQFVQRDASEIPEWLYGLSHEEEIEKNWKNNKKDVPTHEVPSDANIIGSHVVYRFEEDVMLTSGESRRLKLKARICAHGNQDDELESLRTDAAVANHSGFRMLYSLAAS